MAEGRSADSREADFPGAVTCHLFRGLERVDECGRAAANGGDGNRRPTQGSLLLLPPGAATCHPKRMHEDSTRCCPTLRYSYVVTRSRPYLETKGHGQGQGLFPILRGSGRYRGQIISCHDPCVCPKASRPVRVPAPVPCLSINAVLCEECQRLAALTSGLAFRRSWRRILSGAHSRKSCLRALA